jgi:hypothetical protein
MSRISASTSMHVARLGKAEFQSYPVSRAALATATAASYAPKVGNCELRITKKRFVKVLKCLVQNTPKSKVL